MTTHDDGPDHSGDGRPPDRATDDETPLGDTPEAHDEISPHDIPPGHPMRDEVERRAGGVHGTTEGP